MTWTVPFTAKTGDTISSTNWNNAVKTNLNNSAIGLANAAGDIFYASGASSLAKLALGTKFQKLRNNSAGTAFEWSLQHAGIFTYKNTGTISLTNVSFTPITFDSTDFNNLGGSVAPVAGTYIGIGNLSVVTNATDCNLILSLIQNSTTRAFYKHIRTGGLSHTINLCVCGIFDMAVGDGISMFAYQDSGVAMNTSNSGNRYDCSVACCLVAV